MTSTPARASKNPTAHNKIAATARSQLRRFGALASPANSFVPAVRRPLFRAKFTCVLN